MNKAKLSLHFRSQTMNTFCKSFVGVLLLLFTLACEKSKVELNRDPLAADVSFLSGKLLGYSSSSSLGLSSQSMVSTLSCTNPVAGLYELDDNGDKKDPALGNTSFSR
jgi:hypothetical protein